MEKFEAAQPRNEAFNASRREQLKKYKTPEHPQGREAVEINLEKYAEGEWATVASRLFLVENPDELEPQEQADLKIFIKEAGKRLVVDTFHSPLFAKTPRSTAEEASSHGFFVHDLTHTIAAFDRGEGKDMTPEFMKYDGGSQYTDRDVLEEEVFANLFGEGQLGNFLEVARGNPEATPYALQRVQDEMKSIQNEHSVSEMHRGLIQEAYVRMEKLISTTPLESEEALTRYEDLMASVLHVQLFAADESAQLDEVRLRLDQAKITEAVSGLRPGGRFPQYETVAKNILEHQGTDKNIRLKEMQRVMAPMLERVRQKEEYAKEAATRRNADQDKAKTLSDQLKEEMTNE